MRMAASSSSSVSMGDEKPHVLAVDDSLLDRRLIEKLLTNSSCKGISCRFPYLFCFFHTKQTFMSMPDCH
jgi:hypothetical protein